MRGDETLRGIHLQRSPSHAAVTGTSVLRRDSGHRITQSLVRAGGTTAEIIPWPSPPIRPKRPLWVSSPLAAFVVAVLVLRLPPRRANELPTASRNVSRLTTHAGTLRSHVRPGPQTRLLLAARSQTRGFQAPRCHADPALHEPTPRALPRLVTSSVFGVHVASGCYPAAGHRMRGPFDPS